MNILDNTVCTKKSPDHTLGDVLHTQIINRESIKVL